MNDNYAKAVSMLIKTHFLALQGKREDLEYNNLLDELTEMCYDDKLTESEKKALNAFGTACNLAEEHLGNTEVILLNMPEFKWAKDGHL